MNKPELPINPSRDTAKQRDARLAYIWYLIGQGNTIDSSVKKAGVSRKGYYSWLNSDASLMARHEEIQIELNTMVAEVAKLCALKALTDPRYQTSLIFFLKCRAGWNDGTGFTTGAQEMPSIKFTKPKPAVIKRSKVTA